MPLITNVIVKDYKNDTVKVERYFCSIKVLISEVLIIVRKQFLCHLFRSAVYFNFIIAFFMHKYMAKCGMYLRLSQHCLAPFLSS